MIDFYLHISYDKKEFKEKPYSSFYEKYLKNVHEHRGNGVYLFTNSHFENEFSNSYFEDNKMVFIVIGKVYYRNSNMNKTKGQLSAAEVCKLVDSNNEHLLIKGNYCYIRISKDSSEVLICNSPYGVIPINYSQQQNTLIISSSLTFIKDTIKTKTVNNTALVNIALFDTILGDNTLIREIKQVQYGKKIYFNNDKVETQRYYKHYEHFLNPPIKRKDCINDLSNILKENAQHFPDERKFLMGLTGGYDCRMNFSLIPSKHYKNIVAYTYGLSESIEIKVAEKIAKKYSLNYKKIILEDNYEKEYINNADEVLRLGDGFTPFMRANYYYAHKQLSILSNECLTGMYGSEFIKPMHVLEDSVTINRSTVEAFFSNDILKSIEDYFERVKNSSDNYFNKSVFSNEALNETLELINEEYISGLEKLNKEQRIFYFYLNEGMRKYFMELIRIDKMFVEHYIPYLDLDFLELLLKTEYAGVNNNIFNESVIKRRKGQLLYVDVINKFKPELNNIKVDRGYKPKYLRSDLGWLYITAGYFLGKKLTKLIKGNTTFNTKKWKTLLVGSDIEFLKSRSNYFNDLLNEKFVRGDFLKNEHKYGRHYSIKKWLQISNLDATI